MLDSDLKQYQYELEPSYETMNPKDQIHTIVENMLSNEYGFDYVLVLGG